MKFQQRIFKNHFLLFFFVKSWVICVENITENIFEMSNWGFESPEEWSNLLSLYNFLKNVKTENDPWCILTPISKLLLGQNWRSRTVLKFGEDLSELLPKNKLCSFFCGHPVYQSFQFHLHSSQLRQLSSHPSSTKFQVLPSPVPN